jgi:Fe2+ transport system protein B
LALAGNKNDMYENEEVEENEGKQLAKELGAIFQKTSAKESTGVEDLFLNIGKRFVNPNSKEGVSSNEKGQKLSSSKGKGGGGKKGCC